MKSKAAPLLMATVSILCLATHAFAKPLNVLVLYADDWRFDTPEKCQTMMKNYYRLATEVDATCGRVLAELKKQGLSENTLVIFAGDNGYYHGEQLAADAAVEPLVTGLAVGFGFPGGRGAVLVALG